MGLVYGVMHYSVYQPHLLATNGHIHDELLAIINGAPVQ